MKSLFSISDFSRSFQRQAVDNPVYVQRQILIYHFFDQAGKRKLLSICQ